MGIVDSLLFIIPECTLFVFAFIILFLGLTKVSKDIVGLVAFLGVVVSALFLPFWWGPSDLPLFYNMLSNDGLSVLFREIILAIAGVVILLSMGFESLQDEQGEYYFFILLICVSMMLAVSANNLLMAYLTVEAVSLLSYVLAGFLKREEPSSEAGLKYFLFGALATGIMLYGISFLYGIFGTLDFASILTVIGHEPTKILILVLALIFLFVGLCFKCGLAPFHMWIPDVYQGAPTPVTALLSVGPKAVGFALLIRLFSHGFSAVMPQWILLTSCLAVASMSIGNILAIPQTNVKRLLAYSSIAQAGYIAVGLAVGSVASLKALIFYVIVYALMNLVAFGCVILNFRSVKSDEISDYAGLYKKDPVGALCMTLALLSLAGIPPLAGFWGKFLILSAAIEKHFYVLAIVLILNSLVAVYYYLRIVKVMYLSEPKTLEKPAKPFALGLALVGGAACIVVLGIFPHLVFNWMLIFK